MILKQYYKDFPDKMPVPLAEMLISKMTHDLASPIGAIRNGLELMADATNTMAKEAMQLMQQSTDVSSARLRLYRLAYGNDMASLKLSAPQIIGILNSFMRYETRSKVIFEDCRDGMSASFIKLLFNVLLSGLGCITKNGDVIVEEATPELISMIVQGTALREGFILKDTDEISPTTVQGIYLGFLLARGQYDHKVLTSSERIEFTVYERTPLSES